LSLVVGSQLQLLNSDRNVVFLPTGWDKQSAGPCCPLPGDAHLSGWAGVNASFSNRDAAWLQAEPLEAEPWKRGLRARVGDMAGQTS
jgi:hypothetical protein